MRTDRQAIPQEPTPSTNAYSKDNHFEAQMKQVFNAFKRKPSTMLMVSVETRILRANICRYVATWQREGKIHLLKHGICSISKHSAGYYTTNRELFPKTT